MRQNFKTKEGKKRQRQGKGKGRQDDKTRQGKAKQRQDKANQRRDKARQTKDRAMQRRDKARQSKDRTMQRQQSKDKAKQDKNILGKTRKTSSGLFSCRPPSALGEFIVYQSDGDRTKGVREVSLHSSPFEDVIMLLEERTLV